MVYSDTQPTTTSDPFLTTQNVLDLLGQLGYGVNEKKSELHSLGVEFDTENIIVRPVPERLVKIQLFFIAYNIILSGPQGS